MRVRDMTAGSPARLLILTAFPLMLGNICQQLYTLVDAGVVGRGIGLNALAALGVTDWFCWLFFSVVQGFAQGFVIPVAQSFGAKDWEGLRKNIGCAVLLSLISAALITLLAELLTLPVLVLLGTPEAIRPIVCGYLRILFAGLPVVMAYNLLSGILRGLGDSRTPLVSMVLASLLNIGLDLLFVLRFRWGVAGAAAATVLAQAFSSFYCYLQLRRLDFLRLSAADLRLPAPLVRRLMRLGLPLSLQNCLISVGGMIVQGVVNAQGVAFIAGYTAANKLYGLQEMAAVSFGYALSTYAGQNLGAGRHQRIREGVRAGFRLALMTAAAVAALMFLLGPRLVRLFIEPGADAAAAVGYGLEFLHIMSACLPVLYLLYVYRSSLQGMGDTISPMLSGVVEFAMRTGAALLLPAMIGHSGVFWAEILAWLGADLILLPAYHRRQRELERPA